ncbi:MAG: DMP19 family protein [Flavobacterium sp.]|nr:DMP19 family protein [Flavobacterium sp.]
MQEKILEAYKKIGAPKTANIIAKAIGLFGVNNYYDDIKKRQKAIEKLDEKVFSGWEDLDEIFFNDEQEEDIVALIVTYIRNNEKYFDYK